MGATVSASAVAAIVSLAAVMLSAGAALGSGTVVAVLLGGRVRVVFRGTVDVADGLVVVAELVGLVPVFVATTTSESFAEVVGLQALSHLVSTLALSLSNTLTLGKNASILLCSSCR